MALSFPGDGGEARTPVDGSLSISYVIFRTLTVTTVEISRDFQRTVITEDFA